jgi:hypothetical protein
MKKYVILLCLIVSGMTTKRLLKGLLGDNLERNNQPPEHIIIPLMNTQEADYNPYVAQDIREYRRKRLQPDKDIDFLVKMSGGSVQN